MLCFHQRSGVSLVAERKILTLEHFRPEQKVDRKKVAPHEPVLAVHFKIQASPENGPEAVESLPGLDASLLHLIRRNSARRKRHHPIPVARIEPPAVVQKPPLALQP